MRHVRFGLVMATAAAALSLACGSDGGAGPGPAPVATVTVSPALDTIAPAATLQLTATPKDGSGNALSGRTITWSSSNPLVASISPAGLVSGIDSGSVTITASSEGKDGVATIAVYVRIASVTVAPSPDTIQPAATLQLAATVKDGAGNILTGRVVSWSTNASGVATVSGGLVTGVADGAATITATAEGKAGSATIRVRSPVASVTVLPALDTIAPSATVQLTAVTKDSLGNSLGGRTIGWSSGDTLVATVSGTGLVTGKNSGSATITASSEGKSGTATVVVVPPLDFSGTWVFAESLADIPSGIACYDTASMSIAQTGSTFTGTATQTGTCTTPGGPVDNGGTFPISNGVVTGSSVAFDEPGNPMCHYAGAPVGNVTSSVAGTVSCIGGGFNFSGTWQATYSGPIAASPASMTVKKEPGRFSWLRRTRGARSR